MISLPWRRTASIAALGALLLSLGGCQAHEAKVPAEPSSAPSAPSSGAAAAALAKLTPNELKWGISPTRNDKVTYQDDVIIMEHGADAVEAMASNGLIWTIDANAPHADEIKVDKILFATGRVMGRVLAVTRKGDGLDVLLGPVELTDVIKDANLSADQPIDLNSMLVYPAPDYPAAISHDTGSTTSSLGEPRVPAFFASYTSQVTQQGMPYIGAAREIVIDKFKVLPSCCGGLGIVITHDGEGVKLRATAVVLLQIPSVHFDLLIVKGSIVTAQVELHGLAGLEVTFTAGTDVGLSGNINKNFIVPADVTIPIFGLAVPFSVVFRQSLTLTTLFTAQNGTLNAKGVYMFHGSFAAGKKNGGDWGVSAPSDFTVTESLTNSIGGVSLGVNGLTFGYGAKVIVGIGAFGFVTGPFLSYNPIVGVTKGSTMTVAAMPPCRSAILDINMRYGVGYQIPEWAAGAINFFIAPFGAKPIKSEGGFEQEKNVKHSYEVFPAGCGVEPKS